MRHHLAKISLNLIGVIVLVSLIVFPFYFGKNFSQVAGVKSEADYLVVSQVEKFPGMSYSQNNNDSKISFNKIASNQAFLGVLIITNPTKNTKTYKITVNSGQAQPFFGEDLNQKLNSISLDPKASKQISFFSGIFEASGSSQILDFRITGENE